MFDKLKEVEYFEKFQESYNVVTYFKEIKRLKRCI